MWPSTRTVVGCLAYSVPRMSLKTRTVRSRSRRGRAATQRPRPRVLPLVASKASTRSSRSLRTGHCTLSAGCGGRCRFRRNDETPASTAANLTTLTSRVARLVGGPFVRRPLLVRRSAALAGDLALLLRGHRREASTFLTLSSIHQSPLRCLRLRPKMRANCVGALLAGLRRGSLEAWGTGLVERRFRRFVRIFVARVGGFLVRLKLVRALHLAPVDGHG